MPRARPAIASSTGGSPVSSTTTATTRSAGRSSSRTWTAPRRARGGPVGVTDEISVDHGSHPAGQIALASRRQRVPARGVAENRIERHGLQRDGAHPHGRCQRNESLAGDAQEADRADRGDLHRHGLVTASSGCDRTGRKAVDRIDEGNRVRRPDRDRRIDAGGDRGVGEVEIDGLTLSHTARTTDRAGRERRQPPERREGVHDDDAEGHSPKEAEGEPVLHPAGSDDRENRHQGEQDRDHGGPDTRAPPQRRGGLFNHAEPARPRSPTATPWPSSRGSAALRRDIGATERR